MSSTSLAPHRPTERALAVALALLVGACSSVSTPRQPGEPVRTQWATNLPPFDLQACYPRTDRDWGGDAQLSAMWVAVTDTFPRVSECVNNHFFLEGELSGELEFGLRVQPDHSVAVFYDGEVEDPTLRACLDEVLANISLPRSTEPSGQEIRGTFGLLEGSDTLRVDGSKLGTIVGRVRTRALDSCGCFERYRDSVPPDMKFKFTLGPNDPHPAAIKVVGDVPDQALAVCLAEHLQSIPIATFEKELGASYRFKFENSRAFDAARLVSDGREALNRGDLATAESLFHKVLDREPDHVDALEGLGALELERDRHAAARAAFERALEHEDENSYAMHGIGLTWQAEGDPERALEWFERSLDVREDFRTLVSIAEIRLELGDPDEAREHAQRSRELNPHFAIAYLVEARAAHAEQDDESALELLEQATRLDLLEVSSWNGLVVVYLDLGRDAEAAATAERARERGFDAAILRYNEGVARERLAQSSAASEAFCAAARLEPDNATYRSACARFVDDEK